MNLNKNYSKIVWSRPIGRSRSENAFMRVRSKYLECYFETKLHEHALRNTEVTMKRMVKVIKMTHGSVSYLYIFLHAV